MRRLGSMGISEPENAGVADLLQRLGIVVFRRRAGVTLHFERVDGRCAELLGISAATLTGDAYSFWSRVLAEDRARALGVLEDAVRKGGTYRVEYRLRGANGRLNSVVEEGAAVLDPDGDETVALDGVISAAGGLGATAGSASGQDSERRYAALVLQSEEMIAEIAREDSGHATIVSASPRLCDELGRRAEDLVGTDPLHLVHPQDREHVRASADRVIRDEQPGKVLCRLAKADGDWIWGEISGSLFETSAGERRAIVTGHDVSNRIRVEETFLAQRAAEARIGELSRRFLELGSERLDDALEEGLVAAAAIADADRCYLIDLSTGPSDDDPHAGSRIYVSDGRSSELARWAEQPDDRHAWMRALLQRGEVVRIARLSDIPEELTEARQRFEQRGTKSFCAIPVRSDGRVVALLCLQNLRCEHEWTEQEVALLRLVAELFANALKRREVEGALRDGEQRLRALTDSARDAICETELQTGRIVYANPRFFEMLGHDPNEAAGMSCYAVMHPEDLEKIEWMEAAFARGELGDSASGTFLYRARHTRRGWLWMEANGRLFKTSSGKLRSSSVIRDVTEREVAKRAMARRLEQETLIAGVARRLLPAGVDEIDAGLEGALGALAQIADADRAWLLTIDRGEPGDRVWQWSRDGTAGDVEGLGDVTSASPVARDLLREGRELRLPADDGFAQESPERRLMERRGASALLVVPLLSGADLIGALGFERLGRDGPWSDDGIALLRLAGGTLAAALSRMRTEEALRESRSQLLQAQKMEAVGTLAGGVAHDFNNQLSVILGNSRFVRGELPEQGDLAEALVDLERAGEHCAQLTRSLLSFSRRTPSTPQPVPVSRVVADALDLIRPLMPPSIRLSAAVHDDADSVFADPTQLQQVLVNLMVNARDAMPDGGEISLSAGIRVLDEDAAKRLGLISSGAFVEFTLADDGVGMDAATMARIFEPFFTTKVQGKGTGLGLATVYGLARDCRGTVTVESEVGRGSTFRLLLPHHESEADRERSAPEPAAAAGAGVGVLVVDDQAAARRLIRRMLESAGFAVVEAGDGVEALAVAEAPDAAIDVLVTDLSMPRLGGIELARQLKASRPELGVLLVTGSNDDGSAVPGATVLRKPFRIAELVGAVTDLIESAPE